MDTLAPTQRSPSDATGYGDTATQSTLELARGHESELRFVVTAPGGLGPASESAPQALAPQAASPAGVSPAAPSWQAKLSQQWARHWSRLRATSAPRAITAVRMGNRCMAARVERDAETGGLHLVAVATGPDTELRAWRKLFAGSQTVLVLDPTERYLVSMDRPAVPDADLAAAVRWPLAEALEAEPETLLTQALVLPRINDAAQPQVLAIAGRIEPARGHLALLKQAGVNARSIDICDSALRGMTLLQPPDSDGWVVLAFIGNGITVGLLWQGRFCALRSLPLPERRADDGNAFVEHLALHIQRTVDLFERQSTNLAVRRVLACMPSLPEGLRDAVRYALPGPPQLFDLSSALSMSDETRLACQGDDDLTALCCSAVARAYDTGLITREVAAA